MEKYYFLEAEKKAYVNAKSKVGNNRKLIGKEILNAPEFQEFPAGLRDKYRSSLESTATDAQTKWFGNRLKTLSTKTRQV